VNCLYIHIPFCRVKCLYCSFSSYAGLDLLHDRYGAALCREIRLCQPERPLDTLFIGGGTPTVLKKEQLKTVVDICREIFGFAPGAEISFEANPGTIDFDALCYLRDAGFNRISVGVQSFDNKELLRLGRLHDADMAEEVIFDVQRAGFDNISLDLMYGLPDQTVQSWQNTLRRAMALEAQHLSAYQLSVEENTGFAQMAAIGELNIPAEEAIVEMDAITAEITGTIGFTQYEISNFARPGYECRHNINYWKNDEYLACGAGSVSYKEGVRARRIEDPLRYCEAVEGGHDFIDESEKLGGGESFKETVVMGLRLSQGVSDKRLHQRYGLGLVEVYGKTLNQLTDRELVRFDGRQLLLTPKGRRFANQVMAELV